MPSEELFDEFENRELRTVTIMLRARAERTMITLQEFIDIRLSQGASIEAIRQSLLDDLINGGRIFGEFKNAIRSTVKGSINRIRDAGLYAEYGVEEEDQFRWSAVLVNTCPDCLDNHGKAMTWQEWEESRFGLPRSGGTVCRENCRCVLLPFETTELEPLFRRQKEVLS